MSPTWLTCCGIEPSLAMNITITSIRACVVGVLAAYLMSACSTAPVQTGEAMEPLFTADRILDPEVVDVVDIHDPWEGLNRKIYRFNYRFDRYVFLPVVEAYQTVVPEIVRQGLNNFFNNIRDAATLYNSVLQLNPEKSFNSASRVVWNSTIGLLGFIDVASAMEIPRPREDFGQTLGYWGVGSGPYLVLPILGPSSVRDGIGIGIDYVAIDGLRGNLVQLRTWELWAWDLVNAGDVRSNTAFRYYETGSPFEYEIVRLLFMTKRQIEIGL